MWEIVAGTPQAGPRTQPLQPVASRPQPSIVDPGSGVCEERAST
jgi:hypothetical protein